LSNVLAKIREAARKHPLFKSGPKVEDETRFRYVFGQRGDPSREVVLTVLAFDVPQAPVIGFVPSPPSSAASPA
jgi:hypothetical protein